MTSLEGVQEHAWSGLFPSNTCFWHLHSAGPTWRGWGCQADPPPKTQASQSALASTWPSDGLRGDDKSQVRQSRSFPETLGKASSSGQGWGGMRGQPCESLCPEPLEPAMPETRSLIVPGLQLAFSEEPETAPLSHRPTGPRG